LWRILLARTRWYFLAPRGDLAYKKIFPALRALAGRGVLDIPVIEESLAHSSTRFCAMAFLFTSTNPVTWGPSEADALVAPEGERFNPGSNS
jgi:hypothetical protein